MLTIPELQAARKPPGFKLLRCPHCSQALNPVAPLVIATRNCPSCGRRVVAEPEGNDAPPAFTPEQLEEAQKATARVLSRALLWMLAAALAWLVIALGAVLFRDTLRDAVGSPAAGWIVLGAMAVAAVFGATAAIRTEGRAKRESPRCPHCAGPLYHLASVARLTGNCPTCGRRLAEFPPDEPAGPLPTVAEFKAADRRANRSIMAAIFLLLVALAVPGGLSTFVQPERVERMLEPRYGPLASTVVAVVFMFGWVVGLLAIAIAGVGFFSRRQRRLREANPVLGCPHCRQALLPETRVVASQRCPSCCRRVLTDPDAAPVGVAEPPSGE